MDIKEVREIHQGHEGFKIYTQVDSLDQTWYGFGCPQCDEYEAEWE